jgi:putative transposase
MDDFQSLSHTVWEYKYHLVWIPKYRRKALYGDLRKHLGPVLRELAMQRERNLLEGHLMKDHLHVLISIPPKYLVAQLVGFIKGKGVIQIARTFGGRKQNFTRQHLWARGYFVSTVGRDENAAQEYIKKQEQEDRRLDHLNTVDFKPPVLPGVFDWGVICST